MFFLPSVNKKLNRDIKKNIPRLKHHIFFKRLPQISSVKLNE